MQVIRKTALYAIRAFAVVIFLPCVLLNCAVTSESNGVMDFWQTLYECRCLDDSYPKGYFDIDYSDYE